MPLVIAQPSGGSMSSGDAGSQSAPPINTLICDSGALGAAVGSGLQPTYWLVEVVTYQTGTVDANTNNMLLNIGGTNTSGVISAGISIAKLLSTAVFSPRRFRVVVPPGAHVYVVSGAAAGTAGSIYNASLTLTKLQYPMADI